MYNVEEDAPNMRAALCLSNTVCKKKIIIFLSYNPQCNIRIIHSLWMPDFSKNNEVVSYFVPFHAAHKSWNKLIMCLQTLKSFKLILAVVACLEH